MTHHPDNGQNQVFVAFYDISDVLIGRFAIFHYLFYKNAGRVHFHHTPLKLRHPIIKSQKPIQMQKKG